MKVSRADRVTEFCVSWSIAGQTQSENVTGLQNALEVFEETYSVWMPYGVRTFNGLVDYPLAPGVVHSVRLAETPETKPEDCQQYIEIVAIGCDEGADANSNNRGVRLWVPGMRAEDKDVPFLSLRPGNVVRIYETDEDKFDDDGNFGMVLSDPYILKDLVFAVEYKVLDFGPESFQYEENYE